MRAYVNGLFARLPVWAVWALGLVPLAALVGATLANALGPDPVKTLERELGEWALRLLLLTLAVTPLRRWAGISLLKFRRAFGLLTFLYATLHLLVWLSLDLAFRWGEIGTDLTKRPYIILGLIGFALMLPLAVTSNSASIRRLGALAWRRLHWLVYPAALAGVLHLFLLAKIWWGDPALYGALLLALLALRLRWAKRVPRMA